MTIIKTTNRTKTTVVKTTTHLLDHGIKLIEIITNGKPTGIELKGKDKYFHPVFLDLPEGFVEGCSGYMDIEKHIREIDSIEDLNKYPIYFLYNYGYMIFDANMKIVSIPYTFNYIGSLTERFPHDPLYRKIVDLLKVHPFIQKLSDERIPFYNVDFEGQYGISTARAYLSQEKYEEIYETVKEDEYWSSKLTDEIKLGIVSKCNVYGDEITKLLHKYNTEKVKDSY